MLMALSDSFGEDRGSALVRPSVVAGTRGEGTRLTIGVLAGAITEAFGLIFARTSMSSDNTASRTASTL